MTLMICCHRGTEAQRDYCALVHAGKLCQAVLPGAPNRASPRGYGGLRG